MPAREIETAVTRRVAEALNDPLSLAAQAWLVLEPGMVPQVAARSAAAATAVVNKEREMVRLLVQKVRLLNGRIEIDVASRALTELLDVPVAAGAPAAVTLACELRLTRTRSRPATDPEQRRGVGDASPHPTLVKLVAKARNWWSELRAGETDIPTLAKREGVTDSYVTRVVRLAFLSPNIVEAILTGSQPPAVNAGKLTAPNAISVNWTEQCHLPNRTFGSKLVTTENRASRSSSAPGLNFRLAPIPAGRGCCRERLLTPELRSFDHPAGSWWRSWRQ